MQTQTLNKLLLLFLLMVYSSALKAQSGRTGKKQTVYFSFGTNLSFYSKSDIRFRSPVYPSYDFTLQNVRGKDDQGRLFQNGAPQYSYELGYYDQEKNWGVAFNFDHIKYYVRQHQRVRMQGSIEHRIYDTDTLLTPGFIRLEHSDGANYALLKWMKRKPLARDKYQREVLHFVFKAGAGPVIPKTNSTIMGKHRDDVYTVSGYVVAVEGALRYDCSKILFAEAGAKGAYADYRRFAIADGTGSQQWFGLHFGLLVGLQLTK